MLMLVQMHGEPGSGKSTLATAIGRELPAVVIDKDIVSSALLKAWLAPGTAGPASYEVLWAVARSVLGQGYSVVLDSPAGWPVIEQTGHGVARAMHATYAMVECTCPDRPELERRLATREPMLSQPTEVADWDARPGAAEPAIRHLTLDTRRPLADLTAEALTYLRTLSCASRITHHASLPSADPGPGTRNPGLST